MSDDRPHRPGGEAPNPQDVPPGDDQRRFSRVPFDCTSVLILSGRRVPAHILELSLKGALLERPPALPVALEAEAGLEIALAGSEVMIRMGGQVAHLEPARLGLRCTHIDLDSIAHLRRLIELNTGDSQLVERELGALL